MARQDIYINPAYGECELDKNLTNKTIYELQLFDSIPGYDNDNYCYGQINIGGGFESKYFENRGVHVKINYIPIYKKLQIRFRLDNGDIEPDYLINKSTNKHWFTVYAPGEGICQDIYLPQLRQLNDKNIYRLFFDNGYILIYSGDETDFIIKASQKQNEVFLLKAFAGNLYQYPTTGVGLIEFLHGNFENTGLANKLLQEFDNDKMIVNYAYMDSVSGELFLDVTEKDG